MRLTKSFLMPCGSMYYIQEIHLELHQNAGYALNKVILHLMA